MADAKVLFDVVCNHVFTAFYTKNSETFTKECISLEKLANYKYNFEIQPTVSGSLIIFQSATIVVDS